MIRIEKRVDVSKSAGLDQDIELATSIFLPDPHLLPDRPIVIFAVPGGGYSRGYFFLEFPQHGAYNEAEYHQKQGIIYVAVDHIGVGESTIPDLSKISFETLAATYDSCVRQILAELEKGTLDNGFPPCPNPFTIGMGQSMGGGVTILTQGRFATFDAIAPCGVSAIHTALPQKNADEFERGKNRFAQVKVDDGSQSHETVSHDGVDYIYPFHWEDVPEDILDEDMKGGYPLRQTAPYFGSTTIPHCAVQMMTPGCFTKDAEKITVPVLIANGERDTCPDVHAEPSAYPASNDVSIFIVPQMAHMHNFASTRFLMWERLQSWARMQATAGKR